MSHWFARWGVLGVFVLTPFAAAQTSNPADGKKDPQQAIEPKSKPGEGQKFLAGFVGEWVVEKKFFPRGGGDPVITPGVCKQEMIHDGRFLRSEFVFDSPTGKTTGTGVIGFEPETGLFTSSWVDSRQTKMSFRKSQAKFTGDRIELLGQTLVGEPEGRKSKTVTTLEEKGSRIVHRQLAINPDGTERPVMQLTLTRKPAAAKKE